nr:macrolide 2'-phosphotransferase [Sutcliffiella halmapala]
MTLKVKEIAEQNGILIKEDSIKLNESGLDFQVAHAEDVQGNNWILRLPRREDAWLKTELEKNVLETLHQHVFFEIPVWSVYTKELIAYKQLSGIPAVTFDLASQKNKWQLDEENVPQSFNESLGRVLAELHQFPKEKLTHLDLKVHTAAEARATMVSRMNKVKEKFGVGEALWERWQTWIANDEMWPKETALIHGDVHAGHTLINDNKEVTGLIDWTEAAVTDPSKDFMGHYVVFGEAALEQLIAFYHQAGGITWPFMKEHIIELTTTSAIDLAEFAEQSGSKEYEQLAIDGLGVSGE